MGQVRGVIESANRTKTNKACMVTIAGRKYLCNKVEIEQHVGKEVDCETGRFKDFDTIESFSVTTSGSSSPAPKSNGTDRWYMPFVSNTVAHAIAAGLIKDVEDVKAWAKAAKEAAVDIENPY